MCVCKCEFIRIEIHVHTCCFVKTVWRMWYDRHERGCKVMQEKPGFVSLMNNIRWAKTVSGKAVIPMFSFEGLSSNNCFATHYNAGVKNVSDICGTFDGFFFWQWETFTEFLMYFADAFGVGEVGIYDLQFIPPHWFDNKAFGPNDACTA